MSETREFVVKYYDHGVYSHEYTEKWEKTEDYERIGLILDALDVVTGAPTPGADTARGDTQLLSILGGQAQLLRTAMGVEDALSCSCPVAMGDRARSMVTDTCDSSVPWERMLTACRVP